MAFEDLSIGLSGLITSQRALTTIGHNIANANTVGYSRQTTVLGTRQPNISPYGPVGAGVTINEIMRAKDELLEIQILKEMSLLGSSEIQSNSLKNLQTIFNELSDSSLGNTIEKFFSSLQDLSTNPELTSSRFQLLQDSINLANTFNSLADQFKQIQLITSQEITAKVNEVNSITSEIAALNREIAASEINGVNANDMRDKRNILVNNLSKIADIRVINNSNGSINILLGGTSVVHGTNSEEISTTVTGQGTVRINGIATVNSGELNGLLEVQNVIVPNYLGKLDTLAASIIKAINNIHSEGVGLGGGFKSLTSTTAVNNSTDQLANTGLPFAPSVTTYTTGTVTSVNGGSTSTVTGVGTAFTSNVKANDWIKLSDGNYYKVLSVTNDTTLTVEGGFASASVATSITNGSLYITVTDDATGAITKTSISIASDETLSTLSAKINGISNISTSISNGLLTITAASGYTFDFTKALDTNPGNIGNSAVTLSGYYNGNDNDIYTLTVLDAGTGSIGTGSAVIRVTDASGTVLADLDVGSSYTAGDVLGIADGVSISFGSGTITAGGSPDTLTFDVVNDPDTSNVLTALGINTFFEGKDALTIGVTQYIKDDVLRIAAASSSSPGDNTNVIRMIDLQDSVTTNKTTFSDFLNGAVVELGIETRQKTSERDSLEILLLSLDNRRQEISGVSIEEEMVNIIRFQKAFQASAQFISVVDKLGDVLMGI